MMVLSEQLTGGKILCQVPFEGTAEGPSVTLGTDEGSKNGLLALSGIRMNCKLKHYSEALPER